MTSMWMTDGCGFVIYRYVDRDMFMRHLGQGIGHTLSSTPSSSEVPITETATNVNAQTSILAEDHCHMQVDKFGTENEGPGLVEDEQDEQQDENSPEEEDGEDINSDSESESVKSDYDSDIYDDL